VTVETLIGARVVFEPPRFRIEDPLVDRAVPGDGHVVAEPRRAILTIPGVATIGVSGGSHVYVQPERNADEGMLDAWLHGTVAALLLAQRGRFALHASVVEIDGRAVAVAGSPSSGKSTTALLLRQRGHRLVADDVSPVEAAGSIQVRPYSRPIHVSEQAAEKLGLELSQAWRPFPTHPKLALPTPPPESVALTAVAILDSTDDGCINVGRLNGAEAFWTVVENVYRVELVHRLRAKELFELAGRIAATLPLYAIRRPSTSWTADAVADTIERIAGDGTNGR